MSNNTTLNAMSGGDTVQTFDNGTYKTQAMSLVSSTGANAVSVNSAGQISTNNVDHAASGSLTATGSVILTNPGGLSSAGIQVTGTWAGTLVFEVSNDGANYAGISVIGIAATSTISSATANGIWTGNVSGANYFRVRCSAYTSGTIVITILGSVAPVTYWT